MKPSTAGGSRLLRAAFVIATAAVVAGGAARDEVRIAVIMSQDAPPYEEALGGFKGHLAQHGVRAQFEVYALHGDPAAAPAALQRVRQERAQLVLTLGSIGTQAAAREFHDLPIVAGLILNANDLGGTSNAAAVTLEFPVETELLYLKKLLPGQRNVGVLFNPSENQSRIDVATRVAAELGLSLFARKVESPKDLPEALDSLKKRADVLWGVADQIVLNAQTVKPILLFSLRNRIPFVGLSATWVNAGALYALDRDYEDIGRQCGETALKILQGTPPSALPPAPPRKVVYSINLRTARLLKLDLRAPVLQAAQSVIE